MLGMRLVIACSQELSQFIDLTVLYLAKTLRWAIVAMVAVLIFIIILRNGFNSGSIALQESVVYLHVLALMIGVAYALQTRRHVRVDVFYQLFSLRTQTWVDFLGHSFLLIPFAVFTFWASWETTQTAWQLREASPEPGGLPYVYLLKAAIPGMAILLLLQAIASWLQTGLQLILPKT